MEDKKRLFQDKSNGFKVLIYIFLLLIFTLIGALVTLLIGIGGVSSIKLGQAISSTLMFVVPPALLYLLAYPRPMRSLGFNPIRKPWILLAGLAVMLVSLPLINLLTQWNEGIRLPSSLAPIEQALQALEEQAQAITEQMLNTNTVGGLISNLIVIALIPAIGEEMTFRGTIQQFLIKGCRNAHVGIILGAILFSAFHFQFYGFFPRLLLGIFLGYFFYITKSLWVSIFMHFLNNGSAVVVYYLHNKGIIEADMEHFGSTSNIAILVASGILCIALLIIAWKRREKSVS